MNIRKGVPSKHLVVCGSLCLSKSRTANKWALTAWMAFAVLVFGGRNAAAAAPPQAIDCTNGQTPNMTVEIYNNSTTYNIYPVLFAGAPSVTDTWIQACFQLTDAQLDSQSVSEGDSNIACTSIAAPAGENGIPPGGSATITLPLYSPLVGSINPKLSGQLIDWWQGGGINFYRAPATNTTPPAVLQQHWAADQNGNEVTPTNNPPTCSGCNLHFFKAPASIPNNDPQQLTEYTLGAQPINPDHLKPGQPARLWVPDNVDYDVSYVNYVYMPAVMEPFGNPLIGYIGSPSTISDFNDGDRQVVLLRLSGPTGRSTRKRRQVISGKIPSALEIFLNTAAFDNTNVFIPAPVKSQPIIAMTNEWEACVQPEWRRPDLPADSLRYGAA